jgi:hypothetical protein
LTSPNFARFRFEIVMRLSQNQPDRDRAQICVNRLFELSRDV